MLLYTAANDCQFDVIEAEGKGSTLEIKLLFTPVQPRESEVFGNLAGVRFNEKIPAMLVDLKGQVFNFVRHIRPLLDDTMPGVSITVYTYGEKELARAEIARAGGFVEEATRDLKGYDDHETKARIEAKYVKWERVSWATGEVKDDGSAVED